jgi:hypothetical protein
VTRRYLKTKGFFDPTAHPKSLLHHTAKEIKGMPDKDHQERIEMTPENIPKQDKLIDVDFQEVAPSSSRYGKDPDITEEDFAIFIGKNAEVYFRKFKKFRINEPERFSVSWNWPAFFFTYIWLAYRKMYKWAVVAFLIGTIIGILLPPFLLLWWPLFGMAGNFLYFRHARGKILEVKAAKRFNSREELSLALQEKGGVNRWILLIVIPLLLIEFVLSLLAALNNM